MMSKKLKKIILAMATLIVMVAVLFLFTIPVYGVTNPTTIQWGNTSPAAQYQVFYNVLETGDWLILAESYIETEDTNTSENAFSFSLLNVGGTTVLLSVPLWSYGDRPVSIYISATEATTLGLSVGGAYVIKLAGNPTLFSSSTNNTISTALSSTDYSDQSTATDTLNPLRAFCVQIGQHMQTTDNVSTYMTAVGGDWYVTTTASSLFLLGVPSLDIMCPTLFQMVVSPMSVPTGTSNNSYSSNISVQNILGDSANTGITNLAAWFGLPNTAGAKALILIGLGAVCLFILSKKVQDRSMLLIFGVLFFAFAVWIGIGSWAIMMIIAIIVALLMLYYLWSRGVL
jgi:hypothetical protein